MSKDEFNISQIEVKVDSNKKNVKYTEEMRKDLKRMCVHDAYCQLTTGENRCFMGVLDYDCFNCETPCNYNENEDLNTRPHKEIIEEERKLFEYIEEKCPECGEQKVVAHRGLVYDATHYHCDGCNARLVSYHCGDQKLQKRW